MKKLKVTKTTTEDPNGGVWGDDVNKRLEMPANMQAGYEKLFKRSVPKGTTVSPQHISDFNSKGMIQTNFDVIADDSKPAAKPKATVKPKPAVKQGAVGTLKTKPVENISNNTTSTDRNPMPMQQPVVSSTFSTKDEKMLGKRSGLKNPIKLTRGRNRYKG